MRPVDLVKARRIAAFSEMEDNRYHIPPFDPMVRLWRSHGLDCAIYISGMLSSFNGYVRLPENMPERRVAEAYAAVSAEQRRNDPDLAKLWRGREINDGYDAIDDIEVHGGLTYGPDDEGWVGFDTGHAWDDWSNAELERYIRPRTEAGWQQFLKMQKLVGDDSWPPGRVSRRHGLSDPWDVDWTMDRLEAEVERLALQVSERLQAAGMRLSNGT